jgi:hypothetical protein
VFVLSSDVPFAYPEYWISYRSKRGGVYADAALIRLVAFAGRQPSDCSRINPRFDGRLVQEHGSMKAGRLSLVG